MYYIYKKNAYIIFLCYFNPRIGVVYMKCVNCQKEYFNGEQIWPICGSVLVNDIVNERSEVFAGLYDSNMNMSSTTNKSSIETLNVDSANNFSTATNFTTSQDDLIALYIGKNYNKIKNNKWSWPAFFFPVPYLFYRKQWKVGGITLIAIMVATSILSNIGLGIIGLFANNIAGIYFGLNFNAHYLAFVQNDVTEILQNNSNKSSVEIQEIIKKKGKPAKAVIYYFIGLAILLIIFLLAFLPMLPGLEFIWQIREITR